MSQTHLLFDQNCRFLGEIVTYEGRLAHLALTAEGEGQIGPYFQEWQIRGIPILRDMAIPQPGDPGQRVFFQERVLPRETEYFSALREWMENRGHALVSLSVKALECWVQLMHLPLEERERFMMTLALRGVKDRDLEEWRGILRDAVEAIQSQQANIPAVLKNLQKRSSKNLVESFSKKE